MHLKQRLRPLGQRLLPHVMADRARRHERALRERTGVTDFGRRIAGETGGRVQHGVAAGLLYPTDRLAEVDAPGAKLAGTYESELAPVFAQVFDDGAQDFIDVGCADGYFAVGVAVARPPVRVHAWDISRSARQMCLDLAAANDVVDRVTVSGRFAISDLAVVEGRSALVLVDIEGAEVELLDGAAASALADHHVVVEVHEDEVPGARDRLLASFADTHAARIIEQDPSSRRRVPGTEGWSDEEHALSGEGFRGPRNHWIHFSPAPASSVDSPD